MENNTVLVFVAPALKRGGTETQLIQLLDSFDRNKYSINLILFRNRQELCLPEGITVHDLEKKGAVDLFFILRFAMLVRKLRPAVIYSTLQGVNKYCHLIGLLFKIPAICSIRSTHLYSEYRQLKFLNRLRALNAVVCNSKCAKNELVQLSGIDAGRIAVIPNSIDFIRFHPASAYVQGIPACLRSVPSGAFKLLYCGRVSPEKNLLFILRTVSMLNHPDIVLAVVGPETVRDYHTECLTFAIEHLSPGKVIWVGSHDMVEQFYWWADAVILASDREGTSNALLEAMACGLPALVSETADPDYLVEDGVNGYRFPLNDYNAACNKLLRIMGEERREKYMKINSVKIAENYSAERNICENQKLISSLICKSPDKTVSTR